MFAKRKLTLDDLATRKFDLFISAFNDSPRITAVRDSVHAGHKVLVVHSEYDYVDEELPSGPFQIVQPAAELSPPEFWSVALSEIADGGRLDGASIAVDITGMMRPYLVMLPYMLRAAGVERATFYYSDPDTYRSGERTVFSSAPVSDVRLIPGMEGQHPNGPSPRDVLIIGAGYDDGLIRAVAEDKSNAERFVLFGLPSLQPHMYQESLYRVSKVRESITELPRSGARLFAPAYDPFMTAQVLSDHLAKLREPAPVDHLYLSPVGAKTQVLGFSLYYWFEGVRDATSMLFPFSSRYSRETSRGVACVHEFELELDLIPISAAAPPSPSPVPEGRG